MIKEGSQVCFFTLSYRRRTDRKSPQAVLSLPTQPVRLDHYVLVSKADTDAEEQRGPGRATWRSGPAREASIFWCTCSLSVTRTAGFLSFRYRLSLVCPSNGRSACQRRRVIPVMDCVSIPSPPHEDCCCNSERQARIDRRHNPRRQLTASSGSSVPATTAQLGRKPDAPKNGRSEPLGGFRTPEGTGWMQSGGL